MVNFHVFDDNEELSHAAAQLVLDVALDAVDSRGQFTIALSGGDGPVRLFQLLGEEPFCSQFPWAKTVAFWGDDRVVGPEHEWSNYKLVVDNLLQNVALPESNVYRIKGELGATAAAKDMHESLIKVFGDKNIPCFDIVLQGMGDDGHTASLFPNTQDLDATDWVIPVINPSATPAVDRVTLSFPVLNAARLALFLLTGAEKHDKLQEIMNDPAAWDRYPAARVEAKETVWYVDKAAFGELPA